MIATDSRLQERLWELSDLVEKRAALARLHVYLQPYAEHPNFCHWMHSVERGMAILTLRIELTTNALLLGL